MAETRIKGAKGLDDKLNEIAKALDKATTLKVGFFADATYPDGTPVAMIAAIQDFGAPAAGIPPRPFFRNMVAEKSGEWPEAIATLLKDNDYDSAKTMEQVGSAIEGQLKQSIVDTNEPALKPATIKRKGFSKPLVDKGIMIASTGYKVDE